MANFPEPEFVRARSALLDVLGALGPHRKSAILVGAQAIYVHTGEADFAISPFTYDADLAIDPRGLADEPKIVESMRHAGFSLTDQPGLYKNADGAQVDLLVPEAMAGPGRRGARLGSHGNRAAMRVRGLEGVLVEHRAIPITGIDKSDSRSNVVEVAGPAALLVAKVHKVSERAGGAPHRQNDKDAFDIYRLLVAIDTGNLAERLQLLQDHEVSATVTTEALALFNEYFGGASALGTQMVARHVEGLEDVEFITASCASLCQDLLSEVAQGA